MKNAATFGGHRPPPDPQLSLIRPKGLKTFPSRFMVMERIKVPGRAGSLLLQLALGAAIVALLVWYAGAKSLSSALASANPARLGLALLAYLAMNLIFAYRMKLVLKGLGRSVGFLEALAAQYGGMLASDFTPARSGYLVVPAILRSYGIPVEAGLSTILGCQAVEFLVKMAGGLAAVLYLLSKVNLSRELLALSGLGLASMLLGGLAIGLGMWSRGVLGLLKGLGGKPLIGGLASALAGRASSFQAEASKVKPALPAITGLTLASWLVKGLEWYFIGSALSVEGLGFLAFLLLHPLVTALSFVPLTPSGLGFQEGAAVGLLHLLGAPIEAALAFALLARLLLVLEDAAGIPALTKAGAKGLEEALGWRGSPKPRPT